MMMIRIVMMRMMIMIVLTIISLAPLTKTVLGRACVQSLR